MKDQKVPISEGTCIRMGGDQICMKAVWGLDGYGRFGYYCSAYPYRPARFTEKGCYLSSLGSIHAVTKKKINPLKASKRARR
jgi:hypothetical protein